MNRSLFTFLVAVSPLLADTFHVSPSGKDDATADGKTSQTAWASLAYACDQVAEGAHTIEVHEGSYIAVRTAFPQNGVTIRGIGKACITAAADWKMPPLKDYEGHEGHDEYLIAMTMKRPNNKFVKVKDVTVSNLELASLPTNRITGGVYCRDGNRIIWEKLKVHDFRWNGLRMEFSKNSEIRECEVIDASTEKLPHREGGLIRSRWLEDCRIHHNRIIAKNTGGYGYKGGGHNRVQFDHNFVEVGYFAIESPFENELDFEIHHNTLNSCISVPRSGQPDPKKEGGKYSVRIHHNYLTDSYTIEGPRAYLEFDHNYVHVKRTGGRIYSHHGAESHGTILLHHNVIENIDYAVAWMNEGIAKDVRVQNNTLVCADAGRRNGAILDGWSAERLQGWKFQNNVLIAAWSAPRVLHGTERGIPEQITVDHNLLVNVQTKREGNFYDVDPGLQRSGSKPAPFYAPQSDHSFTVDKGVDVGLPFKGNAPDLGAYEQGEEPWTLEDTPLK
jgi:hypothetical protein